MLYRDALLNIVVSRLLVTKELVPLKLHFEQKASPVYIQLAHRALIYQFSLNIFTLIICYSMKTLLFDDTEICFKKHLEAYFSLGKTHIHF